MKYSPDSSTVRVRADSDEQWTDIEVVDTGKGIPPEYVNRVFERFFRVDDSRERSAGGSGLGLSIARQVVQEHGGQIRLSSSLETGTTFFVRLPSCVEAAERYKVKGGEDG